MTTAATKTSPSTTSRPPRGALVAEVAWHLDRLGHPPALIPVRARILVAAVDAAVHEFDPGAERSVQITELVRLAELFVAAP